MNSSQKQCNVKAIKVVFKKELLILMVTTKYVP